MGLSKRLRRAALCVVATALAATVGPSAASADVTIGQLAPDAAPSQCTFITDRLQPTVTSGTSYVVPAVPPATALVVKSWSYNVTAGGAANQGITMKVFRKIGDPAIYQVVGHDGPQTMSGVGVHTFSTGIPVSPGDVLGAGLALSAQTACIFGAPGDSHLFLMSGGSLGDGQAADFQTYSASPGYRVNVSAVVAPSNSFSVGTVTLNEKKGTATLTVTVPNPGELSASGNGVKAAGATSSKAVGPGKAQLTIRAKGTKRHALNQKGKVKLNVTVTYTPTSGDPGTQSVKVKLRKR